MDLGLDFGLWVAGKLPVGFRVSDTEDHQCLDECVIIEDPFSSLGGTLFQLFLDLVA